MDNEPDQLNRFAASLIDFVRDPAIASCDQLASGAIGVPGEHWKAILQDPIARSAVSTLIPEIVDQVLFELLDAIDNDNLPLGWRADGTLVSLKDLGKGEMAGWFVGGEDGWRGRYSKRRFSNDFSEPMNDR